MPKRSQRRIGSWIFDLLFALALVAAALFRFTGIDWDEDQHLHPDERFLTGVTASVESVDSISAYFDTANSSLNPNNRGAGFFVYGTLPLFIVRYVAEGFGQTGYGQVHLVGRALSAVADLGVVALVYFTASRLFDKRVGLLAAVFSAVTVMQIQQSHFWTVDNFANFFTLLAAYFSIRIASQPHPRPFPLKRGRESEPDQIRGRQNTGIFSIWDFVGFGIAFGMSLASKINQPAVVLGQALMLPAAMAIRLGRLPKEERSQYFSPAFWWVLITGILSVITFRVFQPYAFQGLGIGGWLSNIGTVWAQSAGLGLAERLKDLGIAIFALNPHWVETLASLAAQVNGDADWPPSMQWARRPFWFGLQNIVGWGMGWPLALVCIGGFAWAGWKIYKGDWRKPQVLLWGWGAFYFLLQSLGFNPTMRYFLPVYPVLAIFGGWGVVALWDLGQKTLSCRGARGRGSWGEKLRPWAKPAAGVLGVVAAVGATLWAFAFVQIYQQDVSRVQAARWIYRNVPGPITMVYDRDGESAHQPLPYFYDFAITPETPYITGFAPNEDSELNEITFKYVLAPIQIVVSRGVENPEALARFNQLIDLDALELGKPGDLTVSLPADLFTNPAEQYQIQIVFPEGKGALDFQVGLSSSQTPDQPPQLLIPEHLVSVLGQAANSTFFANMGQAYTFDFQLNEGIVPDQLRLKFTMIEILSLTPVDLHLTLADATGSVLVDQVARLQPSTDKGELGTEQTIELNEPIHLEKDMGLELKLALESDGSITLAGTAVANESSWDDGQPLRIDGYDGFGGIYQGDLNFELYWDEDANKLARFMDVLDRTEYIFITSSRQWGSLPRIPERFPLVLAYYRALMGCPEDQSIESCFINARVGNVHGDYGFELVQVFENAPRLGSWQINDQAAEEAFTVYDHPKVFIFHKTADYDPGKWAELLSQVDLAQVVRLTPKQASGRIPPNLMLPADRLEQQQAGGTWSELFDTDNWINSSPWVSAVVWYLALMALGIAVYPLVRWLLPGLRDGGYPFARLVGLVLLTYFAWMGGSLGLSFSRGWLVVFALLLVAAGVTAAWAQRRELRAEWKAKRGQFLRIELLFLAFFLLMLFIRVANPDLWHPAKGGEKPMDFSYFNAVLKSTSFPPYDPWFAGGYINYYYYGFVLVGSLVKLLGIVPAVAYNLILPSLFAMLALGAYSVAWNLWAAWSSREGKGSRVSPEIVGLAAAIAVLILGNMGSIAMIFEGWVRLGSNGAYAVELFPMQRNFLENLVYQIQHFFALIGWIARGIFMSLGGEGLPFNIGDWYWNPTRIIPAPNESAPITEFPLFTFAYADLHAHMIALPVTVLGLAWALSAVLSRAWNGLKNKWQVGASLILGAIVIGSLRPINTWDFPTYLVIGMIAAGYAIWKYGPRVKNEDGKPRPVWSWVLAAPVALALLSVLAYKPFTDWYRQGYANIRLWDGTQTPSASYLVHWTIFLFFIIAWMIWETRQWMASTPLSSVRKLEKSAFLIYVGIVLFVAVAAWLFLGGVAITWLVLPLLVWVGLLFIRPGQDEGKRLVLFIVGTGLFLTLFVEVIVLQGDISRMNTVFKFYMQAWVLLALGAAFALGWTLDALRNWSPSWRGVWQFGSAFLIICGMLFMFFGVTAKMRDRMSEFAPWSLDGMAYMESAVTFDQEQRIDLVWDHDAIRWLQENVQGSPVIVEAQIPEYRWGTRITVYTGLPTVLGWNWHQRQQREFVPGNDIQGRENEIKGFYTGTDLALIKDFLQKYRVQYIVVGQLERAYYPGPGLDKFEAQDGILWEEVYRNEGTVIYKVSDFVLADN